MNHLRKESVELKVRLYQTTESLKCVPVFRSVFSTETAGDHIEAGKACLRLRLEEGGILAHW